MWDRSKQKYWIARITQPWKVIAINNGRYVCNYPSFNYDDDLIEKVCFAEDDEVVKNLLFNKDKK